jgi:hypothetical protein
MRLWYLLCLVCLTKLALAEQMSLGTLPANLTIQKSQEYCIYSPSGSYNIRLSGETLNGQFVMINRQTQTKLPVSLYWSTQASLKAAQELKPSIDLGPFPASTEFDCLGKKNGFLFMVVNSNYTILSAAGQYTMPLQLEITRL